ncbi:uncharacterized protein VNE69_05131 [Vairimorpha necatrix]|uniref:Uncharacterized protein n=1 Tax=Vairimorpha necatrix TaxID=6039 RepID=A0AAX4JC55_9MICR
MKENENTDDEYSILNIHKNQETSDLQWKTYNQNTEEKSTSIKNKENTLVEKTSDLDNNISYQRYKNIFQKPKRESFYIEEVNISDISDSTTINKSELRKDIIKQNINLNDDNTKTSINKTKLKKSKIDNTKSCISKIDTTNLGMNNIDNTKLHISKLDSTKLETSNLDNSNLVINKNETAKLDNTNIGIRQLDTTNLGIRQFDNNNNPELNKKELVNILKERFSTIVTPRKKIIDPVPNIKSNLQQVKQDLTDALIKQETSSTSSETSNKSIKRKLTEELLKSSKKEKKTSENWENEKILQDLNYKIENEIKLKKEIIKLETTVRLQKFEIEMLRTRTLPKNESDKIIETCKNVLKNLRDEIKMQENEFKEEIGIEKKKNVSLLKEINMLKTTVDNLINKKN